MEADFVNFTMEDVKGRVSEIERVESPDGVDTEVSHIPVLYSILFPFYDSLILILLCLICFHSSFLF